MSDSVIEITAPKKKSASKPTVAKKTLPKSINKAPSAPSVTIPKTTPKTCPSEPKEPVKKAEIPAQQDYIAMTVAVAGDSLEAMNASIKKNFIDKNIPFTIHDLATVFSSVAGVMLGGFTTKLTPRDTMFFFTEIAANLALPHSTEKTDKTE